MRVFISHSSVDKDFVRMVVADLGAAGIATWLDELELHVGDELTPTIVDAIRDSAAVVVCLSPASVASRWVDLEIDAARASGVAVLPVLIGALEVDQRPAALADVLYVDLRQPIAYDAGLEALIGRVAPTVNAGVLAIDDARRARLVALAKLPSLTSYVTRLLADGVADRRDHTERYWSYVALGEIGGEIARRAVQVGLEDSNPFARQGAREAWEDLCSADAQRSQSS